MSSHSLFLERKYSEALAALEEGAQSRSSDDSFFYARGRIHLALKQPTRARLDFEKGLSLERKEPATKNKRWYSDHGHNAIGVTYWLEGNQSKAIDWWQEIVESHSLGRVSYSDASGGVESGLLLWFASALSSRPAIRGLCGKFFEKLAEKKQSRWGGLDTWPGPVAKFFLGKINDSDLMEAATTSPGLRERHLCQAYFARGVIAFERGLLSDFSGWMKRAADLPSPAHIQDEFFLAVYENTKAQAVLT